MKRIFKYNLNRYRDPIVVELPKNAYVIDYQIQNESFKLWALVDSEGKENENRIFILALTGQEFPWGIIKSYGTRIINEAKDSWINSKKN